MLLGALMFGPHPDPLPKGEGNTIEDVFNSALDLPSSERAAFLGRLEAPLRAKVERLLRAHEAVPDQFLVKPAFDPYPPGSRLGRYVIERELGRGGMGVVFAAHDEALHRRVALKLVHPDRGIADARQRLELEARALAKVQHPNVVAVHDVGDANGELFIAMELIDGQPLSTWAHGRPWREVLEALRDAGRGLAQAHDAGVLHRDFKPANVLIDAAGRARVADFGLAGTPGFMAPELLAGAPATEASDVYAYCRSLERLLPHAPGWLAPMIQRGLAEDPAQRWGRMASLLLAIDFELGVDPHTDVRPASRQRTWFFGLLAVVTLLVPVLLVGGKYPLRTTGDAVRISATVFAALVVGLALFWARIRHSPYTRRGAMGLVSIVGGMLVHRVLMLGLEVQLPVLLSVDLLLFASFSAAMGLFWARRYWWISGVCVAGSAAIALAPEWAQAVFGVTTLAMLPLGYVFWGRGKRP